MRQVNSVRTMQKWALEQRRKGVPIAFVPTMGYLHEGHMSLVRRARLAVGPSGQVVVSIYVNPTQFAPTEDLAKYPRDLARDKALCRREGTDILFVPSDQEIYPNKDTNGYSTYVVEEQLAKAMEGSARPSHFRGVTTVVAKLFNIVLPDVAVFGAKDFQQAAVIQRMVQDLNFPVKIMVAPTVREPDGLAMSSRNKYLTPTERSQATILWRAMQEAKAVVRRRQAVSAAKLRLRVEQIVLSQPAARLDYISFFNPESLEPVAMVKRGTQMALAVFIGRTRLIDNQQL